MFFRFHTTSLESDDVLIVVATTNNSGIVHTWCHVVRWWYHRTVGSSMWRKTPTMVFPVAMYMTPSTYHNNWSIDTVKPYARARLMRSVMSPHALMINVILHSHGISYHTMDDGSVVYDCVTTAAASGIDVGTGARDKATALEGAVYKRKESNHNQYSPKNIPIRETTSLVVDGTLWSVSSSTVAMVRSCIKTESVPTTT